MFEAIGKNVYVYDVCLHCGIIKSVQYELFENNEVGSN